MCGGCVGRGAAHACMLRTAPAHALLALKLYMRSPCGTCNMPQARNLEAEERFMLLGGCVCRTGCSGTARAIQRCSSPGPHARWVPVIYHDVKHRHVRGRSWQNIFHGSRSGEVNVMGEEAARLRKGRGAHGPAHAAKHIALGHTATHTPQLARPQQNLQCASTCRPRQRWE